MENIGVMVPSYVTSNIITYFILEVLTIVERPLFVYRNILFNKSVIIFKLPFHTKGQCNRIKIT